MDNWISVDAPPTDGLYLVQTKNPQTNKITEVYSTFYKGKNGIADNWAMDNVINWKSIIHTQQETDNWDQSMDN